MASLNNIKTRLIELQSFDDVDTFSRLQQEVRDFIGQRGVSIGITPFYKVNGKYVFSSSQSATSIILKNIESAEEKEKYSKSLDEYFSDHNEPIVEKGVVIYPLKNYNQLIGTLEIISENNTVDTEYIISKIEPAIPLFELALNRSCATLDARIDKIIKENFTSIQPVVEWKFTEAALNYLVQSETDEDAKVEEILFDNVYPLYGAIDIKNSSEERNKALKINRFHEFDESITRLNGFISKFIDREQRIAQKIYPHYFERFVTDGADFNLYAGQSLTPDIPFDKKYLEDLRMWQLTMIVKAARLTGSLSREIPIPLETTQLVLVHSRPLSICFRSDERRFDVKGSYDVLYEIMKKRIDKVHIKTSGERLTKPGTIAIAYSHPEEGDEYKNYLQILTDKNWLTGVPEHLDLEELQGVKGLKALRQEINYNMEYAGSFTNGSITSKGLIKPSLSP